MVRVIYLTDDDNDDNDNHHNTDEQHKQPDVASDGEIARATALNLNGFSAALVCYPIASQLASYVDLNTLHELSRTCRRFRINLLQFRSQLIARALRCDNESVSPALLSGDGTDTAKPEWTSFGHDRIMFHHGFSGRVGACARDKVGACTRCGRIVCRNCVMKCPPTPALKQRHRRLCRACLTAPLSALTCIANLTSSNETTDHKLDTDDAPPSIKLTSRSPCTCSTEVWICAPCGTGLRPADTTYQRGWAWRTRYSACGGLGAGLGEGNEGVECGRGRSCLAARVVERDVECDAAELAAVDAEIARRAGERRGSVWDGCSYETQEIVGIGGRVKRKVRKREWVGAVVKEFEDERVTERFLEREQVGKIRSWCAWCERVVVGVDEEKELHGAEGATNPPIVDASKRREL